MKKTVSKILGHAGKALKTLARNTPHVLARGEQALAQARAVVEKIRPEIQGGRNNTPEAAPIDTPVEEAPATLPSLHLPAGYDTTPENDVRDDDNTNHVRDNINHVRDNIFVETSTTLGNIFTVTGRRVQNYLPEAPPPVSTVRAKSVPPPAGTADMADEEQIPPTQRSPALR